MGGRTAWRVDVQRGSELYASGWLQDDDTAPDPERLNTARDRIRERMGADGL